MAFEMRTALAGRAESADGTRHALRVLARREPISKRPFFLRLEEAVRKRYNASMKKLFAFLFFVFLVAAVFSKTAQHYKHKYKHQLDVAIPVQKEILEQKIAKGPPEWMVQQIRADLAAYKDGIDPSMLDRQFYGSRDLNLVRFKIVNGQVFFCIDERQIDSRPFRHIYAAIKKLNDLTHLPDVDFIVSLQDSIDGEVGCPIFVYAKPKSVKSLVLIPDFKALTGYPGLRNQMALGSQKYPWDKKVAQMFWRGATTGGWLTLQTWDQVARCKLVLLSLAHPKELNARVNGVVQCDPEVPALIKAKGMMGQTVGQADHLKYKYLVDVDGNSCSFERLFWALLSNSLVFKQMTPNIQWYYGALQPYEHFIPVKEDLSDLMEKYHWAQNNEIQAKKIAENATDFVQNNLLIEDVFLYMDCLIREYAQLQKLACGKDRAGVIN